MQVQFIPVSEELLSSQLFQAVERRSDLQKKYILWEKRMMGLVKSDGDEKCTIIESIQGEVKLIKRADDSPHPNLVTLKFTNLKDCLEYVDKNRFRISVIHSGKRKESKEKIIFQHD